MSLNTIPLHIIEQCAQKHLWTSFAKILLVLTQKNVYRDYLHVCSGSMIIPLRIPPLTVIQWLVRYELYCYGTSEPPFYSTKGYPPSILSVSKLLSIQQFNNSLLINLLTTILPNGKTLAYQSLANFRDHPPRPVCDTDQPGPIYRPQCHRRRLLSHQDCRYLQGLRPPE